ncbi:endonuclease [Formosa algae]|uniref:endonuclease n=1 Tax=Formosa algae TaxID=225843 RepID=UPI000CCE5853|nr:endonuclease [Formosa algae]PNW29518.1 endonuclease I [Formosa algae]
MKYSYLFLFVLFFTCSSSDDGLTTELPIVVNDAVSTLENTAVTISVLSNDTLLNNATLSDFDSTSNQGAIITELFDKLTYTPADNFTGTDTFTYTICDGFSSPNCVTGIVTVTVTDEGTAIAVDDEFVVIENSVTILDEFLNNDSIIDGATLESVDTTLTLGTVVINEDNTITYTATNGFIGEDTFTYTICDDDAVQECATATVTINVVETLNFNISSYLGDYYNGVIFTEDSDLMFDEISTHTIEMHTTILTYTQRHLYLYNADADLTNQDNVILMYTGESRYWEEYTSGTNSYSPQTFNTEHIYPQSKLSSETAVTDLHHLRTADATVNSQRSNYSYVDGSGSNQLIDNTYYPGDDWRGDVARMVMYLNIRYGETFTKVGSLELFLAWNIADPVSEFEKQRNNVIYAAQGNRNPFIDNPYIATLIWGGEPAENIWE